MRLIIAAGVAVALVVFAWQAGGTFKGFLPAKAKPDHTTTTSLTLPDVLTLAMGKGRLVCQLRGATYTCTAVRAVIPPPRLVVAGAR